MTRITGNLDLRKHDNSRWYLLSVIKCYANDGRTVQIRRGFIYDGGSIPRSMRSIVCPMGTAADWSWTFHDGLYSWNRDENPLVIVSDPFSRKEADQLMLEIHHLNGVDETIAHGSYIAVRRAAAVAWMPPAERKARQLAAAKRRSTDESILDQ